MGTINHDALGDYIDDVLVVFTCSRESEGWIICGFYQHARVYADPIDDDRSTRIIDINGQRFFAEYNLVCNEEDAILIDGMTVLSYCHVHHAKMMLGMVRTRYGM